MKQSAYKSFCKMVYNYNVDACKLVIATEKKEDAESKEYNEARNSGKQVRLIFPTNGNHPDIEVTNIPNQALSINISSSAKPLDKINCYIGKFDSWVISPLNLTEMFELNEKYIQVIESKEFKREEFERVMCCYLERVNELFYKYVRRNVRKPQNYKVGCGSGRTPDNLRLIKAYQKWLFEMFEIFSSPEFKTDTQ